MRPVDLEVIKPSDKPMEQWIGEAFQAINEASQEDAATAAADAIDFDYDDVTETITFDPATATLDDVRNVLATLLMFIKKRGPQKSQ